MRSRPERGDLVVADQGSIDGGRVSVLFLDGSGWWTPDANVPVLWIGQAEKPQVQGERWVLLFPDNRIGMTGLSSVWRVVSRYRDSR